MIKTVKGSLFDGLPSYSVIMHQTNCLGIADAGIAKQIRDMYPGWYTAYSEFCKYFSDTKENPDRSKSLLGSFHKYEVNDRLSICSAFAQHGISKVKQQTDYSAWEKILRRVEEQIRKENSKDGAKWSLHVPYGIGCGLGGGDWTKMTELFEYFFEHSPVQLFIHQF